MSKLLSLPATQCHSNRTWLSTMCLVIANRDVINSIYETTTSIHDESGTYKVVSLILVLANMLLVFTDKADGIAKNGSSF